MPTPTERLAVIEEITKRIESKLDQHIKTTEKRISHLERFRWYASGVVSAAFSGLIAYIKVHYR